MSDPFTQAYEALWALLENSNTFGGIGTLVKHGNRIKYHSGATTGDPEKDEYSNADFPQLRLSVAGGKGNPFATSSGGQYIQNYELEILAGDLRYDKQLLPCKWALFKALAKADANLGLDFVRGFVVADITDRVSDESVGWTTVATVQIQMWFERTELKK